MWKMFDDMLECNECVGPLGPPPNFMIPPPPRPPALNEYTLATSHNCIEEEMATKAKQQSWDNDMCEAIPILDASLYSSQSLQTSAMIAVISLLLVLIVLISSLFVWKHKRKVQNLLPCKTPTRGPHITGALTHHTAVTYEDPDVHLGHHRPLVMRHHHHHHHHHNVELLHGKSIHYPSGYPMTRSPPFLVSTSPGPDPYRSNDNVYEELGPSRDSDGESEPPLHSDDDFAEDELSLPGEHSFNKALGNGEASNNNNVSTLYHERPPINETSNQLVNGGGLERHSVLSSASSSNQDASTATADSSNSSHNTSISNCGARGGSTSLLTGMLRHTTGRSRIFNHATESERTKSEHKFSHSGPTDDLSNSISTTVDANNMSPLQQMYDNSSNLMAIGYPHQYNHQTETRAHPHAHTNVHRHPPSYHHSLHHMHINGNRQGITPPPHFYNTIESEVERRNRINVELKNTVTPAVATIFRESIQYPGSALPSSQYYYATNTGNGLLANSIRSRTNPRSIERRRRIAPPTNIVEPAYSYTEPVYHQNYHYETCNNPQPRLATPLVYPPYIVPDYSSGSISSNGYRHTSSGTYQNSASIYNHGDSSFGSDSGYSHHTPASSIGRHEYDVAMIPIPPAPPAPIQKPPNKLTSALSFSWHRKKSSTITTTTTASTASAASIATASATITTINTTHDIGQSVSGVSPRDIQMDASSPNNNSGSSSLTNGLENTNTTSINTSSSSCSSAGNTQNFNNYNTTNNNNNFHNTNNNNNSCNNDNNSNSNSNNNNNNNNNINSNSNTISNSNSHNISTQQQQRLQT